MRKFILVASIVLISASAHAQQTRGLVIASNEGGGQAQNAPTRMLSVSKQLEAIGEIKPVDKPADVQPANVQPANAQPASVQPSSVQPAAAAPADAVAQPKADVARPSIIPPQAAAPQIATPEAPKAESKPRAEQPKRRRVSTEARVIYELHRHGIYW